MSSTADVESLTRRASSGVMDLVDDVVTTLRADDVPGWQPDDGLGEAVRFVMRDVFTEFLGSVGRGSERMTAANIETIDRAIHLRLDQGATLPDVLHSHRVGGAGIWRHLARQVSDEVADGKALIALTPRIFGLLDQYSLHVEARYSELGGPTARRQADVKASLLDTVLSCTPLQDPKYWDGIAALHIPRRGHFVVLDVAHHTSPAAQTDLELFMSALRAVDSAWVRRGTRSQTVLLSLRHAAARIEDIASAVYERAASPVGLSSPFTSIEHAAAACAEAGVAVASTSARKPVVRYDTDILDIMLASSPRVTNTLVVTSLGQVLNLPPERSHPLVDTVRTWLRHNRSVNAAAAALYCHRNTVNYRLRRFEVLAGGRFTDESWTRRVALAVNSPQLVTALERERRHSSSRP
ncbi:hypothetical protein MMAD_18210 [Mycolicibacterium madagascariense]|uniref:PucR family transcriptional regulator n=1 Tax=Mycolicibacterium madagascariense TaxID=212765 RepID=A0A7I7XD34_9MYCO|nr:helix-turn-helix domain-containing protein [Mycolicibacterium madagascariense]MCV7015233.1 helix-turn-helix domain-containing protein [Mycolicibacterium madagascariense]BBZ27526.1 hypothetical protein MMAD_18210 [Mycolicibacterium madagascariense]